MTKDEEYLRLLSIFHYVLGGIIGAFAFFPMFHLLMGVAMLAAASKEQGNETAVMIIFGLMFIVLPLILMVFGWTLAIFVALTGRFLSARKHRLFCLVMAGVECIFMPLGTALGVFTIIMLMRDSVRNLFETG